MITRLEAYKRLREKFNLIINPMQFDFPLQVNWTTIDTIEFTDRFGNFCTYYPLENKVRVKRL